MGAGQAGVRNSITRLASVSALTDAELAVRAGISPAQLNRIRNGRVIPRLPTAIAIARALGRRVREVFYLSGR
jgi:DNA-binding XRE family transcriptional regulator